MTLPMANQKMMRALFLESYNSPFTLAEVPRPEPDSGEVLVRIRASGVNPLDTKIRAGRAEHAQVKLPVVLGIDLAGVVEGVGAGVTGFKPGDEVYGMTGGVGALQGSLADYASVDADLLALKPSNFSMREAAALPLAVITAWEGLVDRARVHAGQKVLVHAGAGGVGHVAVQIARAFGASVFATISADKQAIAEQFGAIAINYQTTSVEEYVAVHTAGEGFDIVFDTVGNATLDASFQAVKTYTGHVVSSLGWGVHELAPLSFRGATYSGIFTLLPLLTGKGRRHHGEVLREATVLAESGMLKLLLNPRSFTLDTALEAHLEVAAGAIGKTVVDVDG
jgi:NADPH2:quinone reductase